MREDYPIVGSYDNQRVSTISAARTVNMYEYIDPDGKRPHVLLPTSGLTNANLNFGTETGGSRATFVFRDPIGITAMYQVFGSSVFRTIYSGGVLLTTHIGNINAPVNQGYVGVDANQFQVMFVDGVNGWIYDTNAGSFEKITDTGFPSNPVDVCALDGYFIVAQQGTPNFFMSELNNGMVWSGGSATLTADPTTDVLTLSTNNANFATGVPVQISTTGVLPPPLVGGTTYYVIRVGSATTNPGTIKLATTYANAIAGTAIDITGAGTPTNTITVQGQVQSGSITSHPGTIVACRTLHRRLFLFSQNYTEVWENAGIGTNLPIRRNNSLLMEVGTPSVGSIATGFDRMFFLSQDKDGLGSVMDVRGTQAIPCSTRALDYELAQYAKDPNIGVADARGLMIKDNGLIFYRLNFTNGDHTYVLNVSLSTADNPLWHEEEMLDGSRHVAQTHGYLNGVNYYGSYNSAKTYIVDNTIYQNDGESIRRMRIGKPISPPGYNRLRIDRWQLDLLQGQPDYEILELYDLLAETGDILLTEAGDDLILDQSLIGPQTPVVYLSISKDGGQSYGYEMEAPMGAIGQRTFRTLWRKLGTIPRGQSYIPKVQFFMNVNFVILGAAWDFEIMPE